MEMTGLDDHRDHVLEIAAVVTDWELRPLSELSRVVHQPQEVLDGMNDWCKENHGKSGLTAEVPSGTPIARVEDELVALVEKHFRPDQRVVLTGNSIGNDRRFVDRYLPRFAKRLHYRMIDVSSWKEVFRDRYGVEFKKKNSHRARDDIFESISELKHYLGYVRVP